MPEEFADFHEQREREERLAAVKCTDLASRNIHVEVARMHAGKAAEIRAGKRDSGEPVQAGPQGHSNAVF